MIRASIDLGTNTCLLLVAEWDLQKNQLGHVLIDAAKVVRLGQGVDQNRLLHPDAMERTLKCLKEYSEQVKDLGVSPVQVQCVATSQARDAKNSEEFFAHIQKVTGFCFRVLSGEQEALFTFRGALLPTLSSQTSWVIDIGGGSTELISLQSAQSIDIGAVRLTERYLKSDPVTDEEFWKCREAIDQALEPFLQKKLSRTPETKLVAVAGTATTLAAWHLDLKTFNSHLVDQCVLTRGDLHRMVEELKWRTVEERTQLPCMEPKRADVLLAGALILWRALEILGFSECQISTRGLRYGIL